jgi:hypothetical protein
MPKAAKTTTTNPPAPPSVADKHKALFMRWLDIGGDIYSMAQMANAASIVFDTFMEELDGAMAREFSPKEVAKHIQTWRGAADFMVHHLDEMATALRTAYEADDEVAA